MLLRRFTLAAFSTFVFTFSFLHSSSSVQAQNNAMSSGCAWLNLENFDGFYGASQPPRGDTLYINAGETINVSATEPTNGDTPQAILLWDGATMGVIAQTSFPGTLQYTFPQDGVLYIRWGVDVGNATIRVSCETGRMVGNGNGRGNAFAWGRVNARGNAYGFGRNNS